jgi:hypothetical protein
MKTVGTEASFASGSAGVNVFSMSELLTRRTIPAGTKTPFGFWKSARGKRRTSIRKLVWSGGRISVLWCILSMELQPEKRKQLNGALPLPSLGNGNANTARCVGMFV